MHFCQNEQLKWLITKGYRLMCVSQVLSYADAFTFFQFIHSFTYSIFFLKIVHLSAPIVPGRWFEPSFCVLPNDSINFWFNFLAEEEEEDKEYFSAINDVDLYAHINPTAAKRKK